MCPDWKYTDVLADYTGQGQDASGGDLRCCFLCIKETRSDKGKRPCRDAADGGCRWRLSLCASFCSHTAVSQALLGEGKGSEAKS